MERKVRIPGERKYVTYNHDLIALIKAPLVLTAFPDDLNPVFSSCHSAQNLSSTSSSQLELQSNTSSYTHSTTNQSNSIETASIGIQTETWDDNTDSQLASSLWNKEIAIAEFEQQNRSQSIGLNNPKEIF